MSNINKFVSIALTVLLIVMGIISALFYEVGIGITIIVLALVILMMAKLTDVLQKLNDIRLYLYEQKQKQDQEKKVEETLPPLLPGGKKEKKETKKEEAKLEPTKEAQPLTFKCKKCNKEFPDETKLRRHIGMSHYKDLEI